MVWKIRSKTAFVYEYGHNRYILPKVKAIPLENINELPFIRVKSDGLWKVRVIHNYRNISRATKQFLLGDPVAEQLAINIIRYEFRHPLTFRTPLFNYVPMVRLILNFI